jgi:catechol 2,3-dioxygenase-like lactoylglutathione lyase family enzyme
VRRRIPQVTAAVLAFIIFLLPTLRAFSAVREIGPIGLTVGDLNRELFFYTNTLPFRLISLSELSGPDQDSLLGLKDVRLRIATLKLGDERITLTEHIGSAGKPIPPDSRSFDHWFQHIAIVVSDMDKAYDRLRELKVKHVSTAPQTLPDWNKKAAGIKAFYFRDPEDHVLEIIWFPLGKGDPKWHRSRQVKQAVLLSSSRAADEVSVENQSDCGQGEASDTRHSTPDIPLSTLFLGIDHTAIVVSDTDRSLAFYRDLLGLRVAGQSENYGVEQEHLNQVFGARLRITALRAIHGPGIEFLEYIAPPGGRPLPTDASPRDLLFWKIHLIPDESRTLRISVARRARILSGSGILTSQIIRDPDGHALQLDQASPQTTASTRQ